MTCSLYLYSQNIPRRGFMGMRVTELNDSIFKSLKTDIKSGVVITQVSENSTAKNCGLQVNDLILSVDGNKIAGIKDYRAAVKNKKGDENIFFDVFRNGENFGLNGKVTPMPFETSDKSDIIYDEVKFKDGYIRVIINKPKGEGRFKTILFIPGYMCYALDNIGKHPYGQVVEKLCEKGYVVFRVEKPGMGDCYNTPDCFDIDYYTELESFQAGFEKMKDYGFVDKNNIFVFGHSLGGYEAPMVDKNGIAKGVIVCGTGLKTWYEYILEMFRFQNPIAGVDYVENEKIVQGMIKILYDFLVLKKDPNEIAVNDDIKKVMKEWIEFDGGTQVWSRHYSFWQQLQDLNMPEIWKNVKSNVLVIRGEGDFEAFSNTDHEDIVKIVNTYNQGAGTFLLIPNMDHGFGKSKTPEESFKNKSIPGFYYNNFNDAVIDEISNWIESLK